MLGGLPVNLQSYDQSERWAADVQAKAGSPCAYERTLKLASGQIGLFIARRFRRLAAVVGDERNRGQLLKTAMELDSRADALEASNRDLQD